NKRPLLKSLFIFILLIGLQAHAKDHELVWLVAPAIWNSTNLEYKREVSSLEEYFQKSLDRPVKVEVKTADGFILSQYFNLKSALKTEQPDFIFYIESTRLLATDLEEILLSKNIPDEPFVADKFSDAEIAAAQPA